MRIHCHVRSYGQRAIRAQTLTRPCVYTYVSNDSFVKDDINMYTVFEIVQLFFSADCGPPQEIANGSPIREYPARVQLQFIPVTLGPLWWEMTPLPAKMMEHGRTQQCVCYRVGTSTMHPPLLHRLIPSYCCAL